MFVQVSSWDEDAGGYRTNYTGPRSYVTAISEVLETPLETCLGHAKNDVGEARMDSESSFLHLCAHVALFSRHSSER